MILYIFISCQKNINKHNRIHSMMKNLNNSNYIIILGGFETTNYQKEKKILELKCNDFYEGLPEKLVQTYKYIYNNSDFNIYSHFCKLDEDMIIKNLLPLDILSNYCGNVQSVEGSRTWHIGKCTKTSYFNDKPYNGIFVPWCKGGYGYILSRKSLEYISQTTDDIIDNVIYEDVYIGIILNNNYISPNIITNLTDYIYSPEHK